MNLMDIRSLSNDERKEMYDRVTSVYLKDGRVGVASVLGCEYNSAGHLMRELGLNARELRNRKYAQDAMKPKCPNPFLKDSHEKFYTLGFILGDGSVRQRREGGSSYSLVLSSSDKEYLENFTRVFEGSETKYWGRGNYVIVITDYPICRWLLSYGFTQAKSFVGMHLPEVPDEYMYSFLLGLMDSDGSVLLRNKTSLVFEWVGHPSYMSELFTRVKALGFNVKFSIRREGRLAFMGIYSYKDSCRIADLMYSSAPFCLERKRLKVLQRYADLKYKINTGN